MESIDQTTTSTGMVGRPTGWVWFAGILLMVGGTFNLVNGFSTIERQQFFSRHIVYSNLTFWGWVFLIWGVLQIGAGIGAVRGQLLGSYVGVLLAGFAAILWFFMIFSAPGAAVLGIGVNVLIVYGLTTGAAGEWDTADSGSA